MDVVADLRESASYEAARIRFQEFFESVSRQLFVLNVIGFVFFCEGGGSEFENISCSDAFHVS